MRSRAIWAVLLVLVAGALAFASWPESKALTPGQRVDRLAGEIRCPTCAGLSVGESSSPLAVSSKEDITTRVNDGQSDKEIRDYFVSRYGPTALMTPEKQGVALIAWVLPIALGVLALVGVAYTVRRWTRRAPPIDDEAELVDLDLSGSTTVGSGEKKVRKPLTSRQITTATLIGVFVVVAGFGVASASKDKDEDPTQLMAQAQQYSAKGDALSALKTYDKVLKQEPQNVTALTYRGWLLRLAGQPDQGLTSIETALAVEPDFADAHFFKGIILLRDKNQPKEAVPELESFLKTNPPEETRALVQQALDDAKKQAGV